MVAPPLVDNALPALGHALDAAYVARAFATQWPGTGPEPAEILGCTRRDTKYEPETRCVIAYELLVRLPGQGPRPCFGVVEVTPTGIRHRLAADDPDLPGLAALSDADVVSARCAQLYGPITRCELTPVRYKPGARCVVRIDLSAGACQRTLFVKILHAGAAEQAERVEALAALDGPGLPRFATLVALWVDWAAIVQREIEGTPLHALVRDPDQAGAFHTCGRCLAGLHATTIPGPERSLADDVGELAAYPPVIAHADKALADRFTALTMRLQDDETERVARRRDSFGARPHSPRPGLLRCSSGTDAPKDLADGPLVASHGALRTDAFLVPPADAGPGVPPALLDLDGFCSADPARDLGNLVAYLDWRALRSPRDRDTLRAHASAFLSGYARARPIPAPERLGSYRAASLLKIAGRRYRSLDVAEWPLVPALVDQAARLLDARSV